MIMLPAAIGSFLVVNLVCAVMALGVGFAAGVWFFGTKRGNPAPARRPGKRLPPKSILEAKQAAERAIMATTKVAALAQGVASDVGEHAARMKAISADLAGIEREEGGANAAVFAAMDKILTANTDLQQRLEQAEKQLESQAAEIKAHESLARTDSLTGLSNRRAFDDELKRRLSEWERNRTPVTLVLLDIDFFKNFNDTHGHQVGDEVLRSVAKTLRKQARDMDLPCRYGGEEFGVVLPATEMAGACIVAERIRGAIEASVTTCGDKNLKVTCSLGLSQAFPSDDAAKIIRRADDALYASKKAGRNCGHWSDGTNFFSITSTKNLLPQTGDADDDLPEIEPKDCNGATFVQMLKRRVTESHRFGIPLTIMHLKIDEYDAVCKASGRAIGRQMLDLAEPALEKALREMDVLARLDHGEFVVMLPGNTQAEAAQLVKRMRITMSNCVVPLKDREIHIRFRHGIAELKTKETAQELLARARHDVVGATPARRAAEV